MADVQLSTLGEVIKTTYEGVIDSPIVRSIADLPAPVSGVITTTEPIYEVRGNLDLGTNRLEGGSQFLGRSPGVDSITYSGTGIMATAIDNESIGFQNLALNCPNGVLFSKAGDGVGDFVSLNNCNFIGVNAMGNIDDCQLFSLENCLFSGCTHGFSFTGTSGGRFVVNGNTILNTTNTFFALGTAVYQNYSIIGNQSIVTPSGGTFMSGAVSSANVGIKGLIETNVFSGDGDVLSDITVQDIKWKSSGNEGLKDTETKAEVYISTPAVTSLTVSTPTLIAGTYSEVQADGFTTDSNGRITSTMTDDVAVTVTICTNAEMVSGGTKTCGFFVAKNGTAIMSSEMDNDLSNNTPSPTPIQALVTLSTGDYIEAFVQNSTDSTNVQVNKLTMIVQK